MKKNSHNIADAILTKIASNALDEAAYNYIADLDRPHLAWEFLRRNKAYIKEYLMYEEKFFKLFEKNPNFKALHKELFNTLHESFHLFRKQPGERDEECIAKWKVGNYFNPLQKTPMLLSFNNSAKFRLSNELFSTSNSDPISLLEITGTTVGILIDLKKPLLSQFNSIIPALETWQTMLKVPKQPRKKTLPANTIIQYLRIIDLTHLYYQDDIILEMVYNNENSLDKSTYRKAKMAANKLMADYFSLI